GSRDRRIPGRLRTSSQGLLRQRDRRVALVTQPAHQRGPLLRLLDTGERHLGARRIGLRVGEELVQLLEIPRMAGHALHDIGIGVALDRGVVPPDHASVEGYAYSDVMK